MLKEDSQYKVPKGFTLTNSLDQEQKPRCPAVALALWSLATIFASHYTFFFSREKYLARSYV